MQVKDTHSCRQTSVSSGGCSGDGNMAIDITRTHLGGREGCPWLTRRFG